MRRLFVLICSLALVCAADGGNQQSKTTTNATQQVSPKSPPRVPAKSPQHVPTKSAQPVPPQSSHHAATHAGHPAMPNAHIQHAQPIHDTATVGHSPKAGGRTGLTDLPRDTETHASRTTAAKPAASVPSTPVYHYDFRTKSGLIGRDFTKPLTPDEQSAVARQLENGQPKGRQGVHGVDESGNGAYHYNFRTKSGVIGRDFTRALTPDEQSAVARQLENGQPKGTQGVHGVDESGNGAYHYNFRTKSGVIGRDFTRALTPDEQSAVARQVKNGPPGGTLAQPDDRSKKAKVSRRAPQQFKLPSKPNPSIVGAKFEGSGHIRGSETWTDPKYRAFRDYRHEWHDKDWWEHHCDRTHHNCPSAPIVLVCGGWYSWHANYWYPAWGYDSQNTYYPYDGPIYAYSGLAPDQVVANVQAALQALGYYHGPIDGLLGATTREAIANYQSDHGLYTTSAIDEATLAELGMS